VPCPPRIGRLTEKPLWACTVSPAPADAARWNVSVNDVDPLFCEAAMP
jgi:hypothetical protein